ncbi:MAG: 2,3-bisphosphoglycerate-independent phosphoglycerate mutase [Betaproteobacteria bacterium]|nr:MAG: 2,3-bisphosphoglycerate-independent phosphoglycerate mutase [Betaproteobacteria bacterium]
MPDSRPIRRVALIILDGFGHRAPAADNAITLAKTPTWSGLWRDCPHGLIDASEQHVGLPKGQFGNSEVGHLNLGAGRIVYQDLTKVDHAIETGEFRTNAALLGAAQTAAKSGATLHILGLLSSGGVHSHERHIHEMARLAADTGVKSIAIHAFLDGRDTPPKSAAANISAMEAVCSETGAKIATVTGRFFAMDRDKRWERVELAYRAVVEAKGAQSATSAMNALEAAYARNENDEFVAATTINGGQPIIDNDVVVFMNFRADRAREMTSAITDPSFSGFARNAPKLAMFVCLSHYGDAYSHLPTAYRNDAIAKSFGEVVAEIGAKQLRIAETEKYAHVTYFFSGGKEQPFAGEDRILVPSPKVATYDLQPEMSAPEVTDKLVAAIESQQYGAIVCNYANGDMVGHTGDLNAAIKAVEALDAALTRVVAAARANNTALIITADHGNCEQMFDPEAKQAHTQHTTDKVPVVYVGNDAVAIREGGALRDIAPTLLKMMGVAQPNEMTGQSLI